MKWPAPSSFLAPHPIDSPAERALMRAAPRLKRISLQRLVAVLTGRSEFKADILDVTLSKMGDQWLLAPFPLPLTQG